MLNLPYRQKLYETTAIMAYSVGVSIDCSVIFDLSGIMAYGVQGEATQSSGGRKSLPLPTSLA